jgi:hypothetical protein
LQPHKAKQKSKRATKPTHQDSSKQWTTEQRQIKRQQVTAVAVAQHPNKKIPSR